MNETQSVASRIKVSFKKSSSDKGQEGFDIEVLEGATEAEAERVMAIAQKLRQEAMTALGKIVNISEQLEDSLKQEESKRFLPVEVEFP